MNNNTEFAALYEFVTLINKYTNVFSKQQIYCTLKRTCMHTKILQLVHVIAKNIHVLIKRKKKYFFIFFIQKFYLYTFNNTQKPIFFFIKYIFR